MMRYCNPNLCLYEKCNIKTKDRFCKKHKDIKLDYIPYFYNIDPFIIENTLINFQVSWKRRKLKFKNRKIIRNIKNLVNNIDPLTQEYIFKNKYLLFNIDDIYPIIVNKKMFVYKLESLIEIIKYDKIEIFTQTNISDDDINIINELSKLLSINMCTEKLTKKEKDHILKIDTLQKFDILGTYFPVKLYNNIAIENKKKIYNELKLMWNAFCQDNCLDEKIIFKSKINWVLDLNEVNIDEILINQINFLLDDDIEFNLKKMITYIIIGAFAYVDTDIKKIYNDYDFI